MEQSRNVMPLGRSALRKCVSLFHDQYSVAPLVDPTQWFLVILQRRVMFRLVCNLCGVTTGSKVARSAEFLPSSLGKCPLSVVSWAHSGILWILNSLDTKWVLSRLSWVFLCISVCWPQAPYYAINTASCFCSEALPCLCCCTYNIGWRQSASVLQPLVCVHIH